MCSLCQKWTSLQRFFKRLSTKRKSYKQLRLIISRIKMIVIVHICILAYKYSNTNIGNFKRKMIQVSFCNLSTFAKNTNKYMKLSCFNVKNASFYKIRNYLLRMKLTLNSFVTFLVFQKSHMLCVFILIFVLKTDSLSTDFKIPLSDLLHRDLGSHFIKYADQGY